MCSILGYGNSPKLTFGGPASGGEGGGRVGIPSSDFGLFNLTQALSRERVIHTATVYFAPTLSQHNARKKKSTRLSDSWERREVRKQGTFNLGTGNSVAYLSFLLFFISNF